MHIPRLSVRARLFALSFGLLTVFGGASLLLGYLILRNQDEQRLEQEQYRRSEIIDAVQQAMAQYRHMGGEVNSAIVQKQAVQERHARQGWDEARREVDAQLLRLAAFDQSGAQLIQSALKGTPEYSEQIMQAMASGHQAQAAPLLAELYQRFNLIESTLRQAALRERNLAQQVLRQAKERADLALELAVMLIMAAGLVGVLLAFAVVGSIIGPLRVTTAAIRQVNAGETEIDLPPLGNDEFGEVALALRQFRDNAEKLRRLAYQDGLTGLGNRARLQEDLQGLIERSGAAPVLFYFDLDNFRTVNDRLGYRGGDAYLCEAAARLQRLLPKQACLYRYGGDKFIALLENPTEETQGAGLLELTERLLRGVGEPYRRGEDLLHMSVSIGVAAHPGDGLTTEHLISSVEAAGHAAKRSGRNNARFAGGQLTGELRRQLALAGEIRRGLDQGEFELHYQPIVDLTAGRACGAEALVRWRHPGRGLLLPGQFIQAAEEEGLIGLIGEFCLRAAHAQLRQWQANGLEFRVAVNLSARQLQDGRVLPPLAELRRLDAAAAAAMDLELTESVLFDSSEQTRRRLDQIKASGYRLGMDDFGTGYSSFAYLRRLPIDKIKIDREFVADLGQSRQSEAIISAMLTLAQKLDLEVVAEGVETPLQQRMLRDQGCRLQQGYLYSAALPAAGFERWAADYARQQPQSC